MSNCGCRPIGGLCGAKCVISDICSTALCEQAVTCLACADSTPLAGASAGSLITACHHSGLSVEQVTDACLVLADDCRRKGTRGRLGTVLSRFLHDLLPEDAHERCRNKIHVRATHLIAVCALQLLKSEASS